MTEFALEIENLVKDFKPRGFGWRRKRPALRAVDGLSFSVPRGQIFGLLGPNGAGKTTTLKILTTLIRPTGGQARVFGYSVADHPLEVRRRISVVLQETAVEMFLTVRDNLLTFARYHNLRGAEARRRADDVMQRFLLTPEADRKVMDLSGGFRRRVQVAKTFMVNTPVLFLDEFSTGMDPMLKRSVMSSLREEAAGGRTIVLTTQVLGEAEELCDDILIMHRGKQVARGNLNTLKLLYDGVYEITITFAHLPASIRSDLERIHPMRMSLDHNTVEFTLKAEESRVLQIVTELSKKGRVQRVEIGGASLEDIFLQLTREE